MDEMVKNFNIKEAFLDGIAYFTEHKILSLTIIGIILVILIIAIVNSVKKAKKDKVKSKGKKKEKKEISKISLEQKKIIDGEYELVVKTEASVVKKSKKGEVIDEAKNEDIACEKIERKEEAPVVKLEENKKPGEAVVMEKIEIIKSAPSHKYGPSNTNTTRSGRVYTEEELVELIRK